MVEDAIIDDDDDDDDDDDSISSRSECSINDYDSFSTPTLTMMTIFTIMIHYVATDTAKQTQRF